jgi:haloalkane dehalogenase
LDLPDWVDSEEYPFSRQSLEIDGTHVHYVDEGSGPPLLLLHGNPTWSFTWRTVIKGLRDRYRCVAPDLPGFGLSRASATYGFTPAEHAEAIERLVTELDLREVTLLVQDWGGPIGFRVATRQPDRFSAFVIGNTWAWPKSDLGTRIFSGVLGGPIGGYLILRRNFFVERIIPGGMRLRKPSEKAMEAYRGRFASIDSRRPMHVFPHEIIGSLPWLAEIERELPKLADRPALLVWPTKDVAFKAAERRRWEEIFPNHRTVLLEGAGHYIGEDAPEEIVAAVREFADGSDS